MKYTTELVLVEIPGDPTPYEHIIRPVTHQIVLKVVIQSTIRSQNLGITPRFLGLETPI